MNLEKKTRVNKPNVRTSMIDEIWKPVEPDIIKTQSLIIIIEPTGICIDQEIGNIKRCIDLNLSCMRIAIKTCLLYTSPSKRD